MPFTGSEILEVAPGMPVGGCVCQSRRRFDPVMSTDGDGAMEYIMGQVWDAFAG